MDEARVYEEWKKELGIRDPRVLKVLWKRAKSKMLVGDVVRGELQVKDLVDDSRETYETLQDLQELLVGRLPAKSRDDDKEQVWGWLRETERERKAALEEYLAKYAACDLDVFNFRREVLGGELLSKEQAWKLLRSPAAAYLEWQTFRDHNIPLVEHTATVKDTTPTVLGYPPRYTATVEVNPPGITKPVQMPVAGLSGTKAADKHPVLIGFPDEEGVVESRRVWEISLLGELQSLGEKLADRYRWQPAQAVWFVLTGEVPAIVPLKFTQTMYTSNYHRDPATTIEAATWLSADTVRRAFLDAQAMISGGSGRSPSKKNLRLFRFVVERTDPLGLLKEGKKPADVPKHLRRAPQDIREAQLVAQGWYEKVPEGKELVREWNQTYPEWSYIDTDKPNGLDTRRFWRDYNRIKQKVGMGISYRWNLS